MGGVTDAQWNAWAAEMAAWASSVERDRRSLSSEAWAELVQADRPWSAVQAYSLDRLAKTHWGKAKEKLDMLGRSGPAPPAVPLAAAPPVGPPPPSAVPAWQFGIVCRPATGDAAKAAGILTTIARVEFGIGGAPSSFDGLFTAHWQAGIRIQPLAGFVQGVIPTTAQAQGLLAWAQRFGPGGTFWVGKANPLPIYMIEFGNETSYGYQAPGASGGPAYTTYRAYAADYAVKAKAAKIALTGTEVGLLVQLDDNDGYPWVDGMHTGVADLHNYADGWTIHPYGTGGPNKMNVCSAQAVAAGWGTAIPWFVTEWGLSTDDGLTVYQGTTPNNYGFSPNMTYAQAATQLNASVAGYRATWATRLKQFLYYDVADDAAHGAVTTNNREKYFGLLQQSGADKAVLTPAARVLCGST